MDGQESGDKQEKTSTKVRFGQTGGVNVGGLLVVVGALAVSGLVGVVASRMKKRRDANKNRGEDEGRSKGGGLPSVLETPPHQNQCSCKSYELRKTISNRMDSVEMLSDSLILEESLVPGVLDHENGNPAGGDKEVLVKGSVPAAIVVAQAQDEPEEIQLPAPAGCFDTGEETPVSEVGKAEQSTGDMEAGSEETTTFQPLPEKQAGQGNYNCEDQETIEEDHIIEKNEEVPEGTGNTSGESGAWNIRPSDLLRDLPPAPKATFVGLQEKMVEEEEETDQFKGSSSSSCNTINSSEDGTTRDLKDSKFFQKMKALELLVVSDQVEHKLKTGIWGLSLLGIMLMFCYYLPMTTACLTALFVAVLSFKA